MEPELKDLASRLAASEELTPDEEASLLRELERDPRHREAILADEAVDSLLKAHVRLPQTREDFVRATVGRVAAARSAPPVRSVVVRPPARRVRRIRSRRWLTAAACVAAVLLLGASLWPLVHRDRAPAPQNPTPIAQHKPKPPAGPTRQVVEPPLRVANDGFVRLVHSEDAVWETPRRDGDRLAAGTLRLVRGTAELRFDKGTVARLAGPAVFDLRSGDELFLRRGAITARVPPTAVGFTVLTPVSRVVDRGTEFDVRVSERGATETVVRQGRVDLTPQREGEKPAKSVALAAGELDRASVSLPDVDAPLLPVSTTASGSRGRFLGQVSVDGKTVEFQKPEAFREFEASVVRQLRQSPEKFRQQWSMSVHASGRGSKASAWVEIDGQRHQVEISGDDGQPPPPAAAKPDRQERLPDDHHDARQLLREQLDEMRQQNADDPAMKKLIEDVRKQLDDM